MIMSMYAATFMLGILFCVTYTFFYYQIVIEQIVHKIVGLIQCATVYIMLRKSGSGLRLVPHKLNGGAI